MPELICHLFGDYVFQNQWMADNKVKRWFPAIVHASIYTSMFLFVTRNPAALSIIGVTHLIIDRFRLARYWVEFFKVGTTAPDFLRVWLLIIVDNSFHLAINHASMMLV